MTAETQQQEGMICVKPLTRAFDAVVWSIVRRFGEDEAEEARRILIDAMVSLRRIAKAVCSSLAELGVRDVKDADLEKVLEEKRVTVKYSSIPGYESKNVASILSFLSEKNLAEVEYRGPPEDQLECKARRVPGDPWTADRKKSGLAKLRSFYLTSHEPTRRRRVECWAQHLELDFTHLLKTSIKYIKK